MMLRHPSETSATPRGEGCSSTAVEQLLDVGHAAWNNPAGRGSARPTSSNCSAVP
jgi:hypothetical protein